MLQLRAVHERDWPMIAILASNEFQQGDHRGLEHFWLENRRSFIGVRKQAVAEVDGSIVGYCSVERYSDEASSTYRMFLVADWNQRISEVHEELFTRAEEMLRELGATQAWMRELTGDRALLGFMEHRGFAASAPPYTVAGREMVNLTKQYDARASASA